MPGETRAADTPQRVPIKEHFEALLAEMDKRFEQRFDAQEKAVLKAETAAEKRFESVNEFRAQLSDQAATFMPRREAESSMKAMTEKYEQLAKTNATNIDTLERRMDRNEGRSSGFGQGWAILIGAVTLIVGLIAIYAFFTTNARVERNTARIEQSVPIPVTAPAPLPVKPVKDTP